jgi:hypothetical protein
VSLCSLEERGEVDRREGKEGSDGRDKDREGREYKEDLGELGGEELGELLLSEVKLALFLYFLPLFLFFFVAEVWEVEDWLSERLDSDCVHDLLRGMESLMVLWLVCGFKVAAIVE